MAEKEKFYITTTLPYVNADPHIGFALEIVQADVIARYQKLLGKEVFFNTGTDEHGVKVYNKAKKSGKEIQAYVDEYAGKFKRLMPALGISDDIYFIRTTEEHHIKACQEFWKRVDKNGYIKKKNYKVKYCVGCELEKTDKELEKGKCPIHPNLGLEIREEENYFFKFSKLQKKLLSLYKRYPDFVVPDFRFNEIRKFVESGLQDFSISRLKEKMPWGVPVPGDQTHVMYVWFDALINYISTLGWPPHPSSPSRGEEKGGGDKFVEFWGTADHPRALQIAGKDNLRQQSAMWQAMLLAAGLPSSRQIIIHGFITSGGQKMSKSLGNVADPYQILDQLQSKGLSKEQAIDALRFYLLGEISTFEDGDYSWEHLVEIYNAKFPKGLGNLVSRITTLIDKDLDGELPEKLQGFEVTTPSDVDIKRAIESFRFHDALGLIWQVVDGTNKIIQEDKAWEIAKTNKESFKTLSKQVMNNIKFIANQLAPFLPETSKEILKIVTAKKIKKSGVLFPRIS